MVLGFHLTRVGLAQLSSPMTVHRDSTVRAGTVLSTWCLSAQEVLLFDMAQLTQNPLDHMMCVGGDPVPPSGPIAAEGPSGLPL